MGNSLCICNNKDNPSEMKFIEKKTNNILDLIPKKGRANIAPNYYTDLFEEKRDQSNEKILEIYYLNNIKKIQKAFSSYRSNKSTSITRLRSANIIKYPENQDKKPEVQFEFKIASSNSNNNINININNNPYPNGLIVKEEKIKLENEYLVVQDKLKMNLKNYPHDAKIYNKSYSEKKIKEGFGMQEWSDGAKFIGIFLNDKANGFGKFSHLEGDDYSGEFLSDRANGFGIYTHSNGGQYEGTWLSDCQDGFGIEKWADNSFYKGQYKNGKKHGCGTYIWSDGSRYEGEWKENCLNGYGIYYFTDLRTYIGEWKNNAMNGFGEFRWKDGKKYFGFYKDDKKEGFGIYFWREPQIKVYIGFWKNGKHDGIGKYLTKEKTRIGLWSKGEKMKWLNDYNEAFKFFKGENTKYFQYFTYTLNEVQSFISD